MTALLHSPATLSETELTAACLDGDLVMVGEAFLAADAPATAWARARSLRPLIGDTLAVSHRGAAWLHGAIPIPPARICVQRAVPTRINHVVSRRLHFHDTYLEPPDALSRAGIVMTSPVRTVADLARSSDDEDERALHAMVTDDPDLAPAALAWFAAHRGRPGTERARRLLTRLIRRR